MECPLVCMTGGQVHQLRFFLKRWIFNDAYKELWINSQLELQAFLCCDEFELNTTLLYSPHFQSETCSNLRSACASTVSLLCFTALTPRYRQRSDEQRITLSFLPWFQAFCSRNAYSDQRLHVATCSVTQQRGVQCVRHLSIWAYSCSVSSTQPLQGWCCAGSLFTNQHPKKNPNTFGSSDIVYCCNF